MATNICSRKRTKFCTVKELAEELATTPKQIYQILKEPAMQEVVQKIGKAGIRVKKERFYEILSQIYR